MSDLFVTLAGSTAHVDLVRRLVERGAAGVRLIAKGYSADDFAGKYFQLREAGESLNPSFEVILDLPAAKPRVAADVGERALSAGECLSLVDHSADAASHEAIPTVGLATFRDSLRPGHRVLISDGAISLVVKRVERDAVLAEVVSAQTYLESNRSINLPDSGILYNSRGDGEEALAAVARQVQGGLVAVSMVASSADVGRVRETAPTASVIAKIESSAGLEALAEVADASDELMVARGDLSIELPFESLGRATTDIIRHASAAGRPVMLATGILDSLLHQSKPAISDISDLWLHYELGVRRFLLSGSVAVKQPLEATGWAVKLLRAFASE